MHLKEKKWFVFTVFYTFYSKLEYHKIQSSHFFNVLFKFLTLHVWLTEVQYCMSRGNTVDAFILSSYKESVLTFIIQIMKSRLQAYKLCCYYVTTFITFEDCVREKRPIQLKIYNSLQILLDFMKKYFPILKKVSKKQRKE